MRTGERARPRRGATYLVLLFAVALSMAAAAAAGPAWRSARVQQDEAELLFRARQIVDALRSHVRASLPEAEPLPATLDELLEDRRGSAPRHHLRRLWADPFTGRADWALLRDGRQRIVGVASRAQHLPRRVPPPDVTVVAAMGDGKRATLADWHFVLPERERVPAAPAGAAPGTGREP